MAFAKEMGLRKDEVRDLVRAKLAPVRPTDPLQAPSSDDDIGDNFLANRDRETELMALYPPEVLKSKFIAEGDLEYKVKYVLRTDEEKIEAHCERQWTMADEAG